MLYFLLLMCAKLLFPCSAAVQYGAAVVYLFEAAPVGRKGLCASLAQQAVGAWRSGVHLTDIDILHNTNALAAALSLTIAQLLKKLQDQLQSPAMGG